MIESYDRKKNVKNIMLKFEELGFKDRVKNEKEAANIEYSVLEFVIKDMNDMRELEKIYSMYSEEDDIFYEKLIEITYNNYIKDIIKFISKDLLEKVFDKILDSTKIVNLLDKKLKSKKIKKKK
jgi:hypothetical protein